MPQNFWDADPVVEKSTAGNFWDADPVAAPEEPPEPTEPPKRGITDVIKDIGVTGLKGAVGLPQAIVGLADIPTGGNIGKALEGIGYRPNETQKTLESWYSPAQQEANRKVHEADGFVNTLQAAIENPSVIATTVGESIPQMIGGAGIARGLIKVGQVAGKAVAPWVAGAVGEGVIGAGSAAEGIRGQTEDGLLSAKQSLSAAASGIGTAAFGALGGKLASSKLGQKLGLADIDTIMAGGGADAAAAAAAKQGFIKQVIASGISESALEELPQSIQEQMWQNFATDKPLTDGVGNTAALSLLAGGVMGGAGGGYNAMVGKIAPDQPAADIPQSTPPALGLPGYANPTMYAFSDGSVGTQNQIDEHIASFPIEQRAHAMASLMYGAQPVERTAGESGDAQLKALPSYQYNTMYVFSDGSTGTQSQIDQHLNSLKPEDRVSALAKLMYGAQVQGPTTEQPGSQDLLDAAADAQVEAATNDANTAAKNAKDALEAQKTPGSPLTNAGLAAQQHGVDMSTAADISAAEQLVRTKQVQAWSNDRLGAFITGATINQNRTPSQEFMLAMSLEEQQRRNTPLQNTPETQAIAPTIAKNTAVNGAEGMANGAINVAPASVEGGSIDPATGGTNGVLQSPLGAGTGRDGMPGAPVAVDADRGASPGGVRTDAVGQYDTPAVSNAVRQLPGNTAITREAAPSNEAMPYGKSTATDATTPASTPQVPLTPRLDPANPLSHANLADTIKPAIEQLIKRKAAAGQVRMGTHLAIAINKAKAAMDSGTGKAADFVKAAKQFKGKDEQIHTTLMSIANALEPAKAAAKKPQKASTDLLQRIKQLGGIDGTLALDITGEPRAPGGWKFAFKKGGTGLDDLATMLSSDGFMIDTGDVDGSVQQLRDMIRAHIGGERNFKAQTQEAQGEAMARDQDLNALAQRADELGINWKNLNAQQLSDAVYEAEDALAMDALDAADNPEEAAELSDAVFDGIADDGDIEFSVSTPDEIAAWLGEDDGQEGNTGTVQGAVAEGQEVGAESNSSTDRQEAGAGQEVLQSYTAAEVAQREAAQAAQERAQRAEEEDVKAEQAKKDQAAVDAKKKSHAENPENFVFGESKKDALKPMGSLFNQPAQKPVVKDSLTTQSETPEEILVKQPYNVNTMAGIAEFEHAKEAAASSPENTIVRVRIAKDGLYEHEPVKTLYGAFVANGDGTATWAQARFPASKENPTDAQIMELAEADRLSNKETEAKIAEQSRKNKAALADKGIVAGLELQSPSTYVPGKKGMTTFTRAKVVAIDVHGIAEVHATLKGSGKTYVFKADANSRLFEKLETKPTQEQATAILDRANVTGKDRLDIMRDFKDGKHSLEDLEKAYPDAGTPPVERGSAGAALTKEQKKSVLKTLVDVYKTKGAEKESKGLDRNGNERMGYAYQPELFEKSEITGAMVRYYVTLPDGRIAHPTELFPEYTQSDIDAEMSRRQNAERNARLDVQRDYARPDVQFDDKATAAKYWDEKSEASKAKSVGGWATVHSSLDRDLLTNGEKFIMVPSGVMKNGDMVEALAAEGWKPSQEPKAEQPASGEGANTSDSGAELTYNKRNRMTRGIKWEDIADKNESLRVKEVTKAKVYPKPDYDAIIAANTLGNEQLNKIAAHLVKQVYDSISAKPQTRTATDEQLQEYIAGVNRVMDGVIAWASNKEQVSDLIRKVSARAQNMRGGMLSISALAEQAPKGLLETVYPNGFKAYGKELYLIGGNKPYGALQPGVDSTIKAMKDIEKGWPAAQESWQRQGYAITPKENIEFSFHDDTRRDGTPYSSLNYRAKGQRSGYKTLTGATIAEARTAAEAYRDSIGDFVLTVKNGDILGSYATEDEAIEAAREAVKRESKTDQISEKGWSVEAAERIGVAHRMEGENITSDKLKETFGFKGVNFGNWMKGETKSNVAERQAHLNHAYDAFLDLADIVGVPPKAISLNGMLGLAIGAQGSGKNLAHFVPGVNEINLTRTGGAGALSHEWAHALDHYFATLAGLGREESPYLTEKVGRGDEAGYTNRIVDGKSVKVKAFSEELRPEVLAQFKAVVQAMAKKMSVAPTEEEAKAQTEYRIAKEEKQVESWLKAIRRDFDSPYFAPGRSAELNEVAKQELLKTFDALASKVRNLEVGDGLIAASSSKSLYPVIAEMRDAYKKATERVYSLDQAYGLYLNVQSLKHLKDGKYANAEHVPRLINSDYKNASLAAEKDGRKNYWATNLEMFARAFDAYVVDTLAEKAAKNSYLSGIEAVAPAGEERKAIGRAFDFLLAELKTKETDNGVALHSQGEQVGGQTVESVTKATAKLRARWLGFRRIQIIKSVKEIPNDVYLRALRALKPISQNTEGVYDPVTNTAWLIADNIASPERSVWVAVHEIVGHGGIRMLDRSVAEALEFAGRNGYVKKLAQAIAADRGETFDAKTHTDEAIAELAAATITGKVDAILERYGVKVPMGMRSNLLGMIKRVVDAVRQFIGRVTGKPVEAVSDGEVLGLIRRMKGAVEGVEQGYDTAGVSNGVMASKAQSALAQAIEAWKQIVDEHINGKRHAEQNPLIFTSTPASMQVIGLPDLPVRMKGDHALDYIGERISAESMKQLPAEIADPKLVYFYEGDKGSKSINFVTGHKMGGKQIVVALHPSIHTRQSGKAHYVATVMDMEAHKINAIVRGGGTLYVGDLNAVPGMKDAFLAAKRENGREAVNVRELASQTFSLLPTVGNSIKYKSAAVNMVDHGDALYSIASKQQSIPGTAQSAQSLHEWIATAEIKNNIASKARDWVSDALIPSENGSFNWWHKTVGTQLHKARVNPHFAKVFDLGQKFMNDITMFAQRAEVLAPNLLPRADSLKGFFNRGISKADSVLVANALNAGTLEGGTDPRDGVVWSNDQLKSKFNMNKEQIGYYREARAAIDQSLDDMALSEIIRELRVAKVDERLYAPLSQANAPLSKVVAVIDGTLQKMQQRMEDSGDDVLPIMELRGRIGLKVKTNDVLKKAGYAPLMRFGRYTVTGYTANEKTGENEVSHFFMFESKSEALRAEIALKGDKEISKVVRGEYNDEQFKLFKGISPSTIETFANHSDLKHDQVFQDFLKMAVANRSAMKRMIHRKGTTGFENDATRSVAAFILSNSRRISGNLNSAAMNDAVMAIPKEQGDVAKEATQLVDYINNPTEEAAKLRGFMFAQYLGGSIAAGLVNITQPVLMTFPYLSQFGVKNSAAHMASGLKDVSNWFIHQDVKDKDLQHALTVAQNRGITAPQEIFQMIAAAQGASGSFYGHKFMRIWGANFAMTEAFNRVLTFSAAYRIGREMTPEALKKAGFKDVFEFAERAVEDTQGIYNKGNRPDWARGAVGATVFTFKQYSISYMEFLKRMYGDGKIPKKQFTVALLMLVLAAGLGGLPGADDLDDLIETLGYWMGYATNSKKWKRKVLTDLLGADAADFALNGVSALPFMPLDVHGRLGMQNIIPGTGMFNPTKKDKSREITEVAGIAGSFAQSTMDALDNAAKGNFSGTAKNIMPKALKDVFYAAEMYSTGQYKDIQGRKVMEATGGDAFVKALGFQPAVIADESRKMSEIRSDIEIVNAKKSELYSKIAHATVDKDTEARAEAMAEVRQWNLDNPDMKIKLNWPSIIQKVRQLKASRADRFTKSTPKEMRQRVRAGLAGD